MNFRKGDRVFHVFNMHRVGTVVSSELEPTQMHLTGGSPEKHIILLVDFGNDHLAKLRADETMKAE